MLRLALIENLRRVAVRIADNSIDRDIADNWADQMIETTGRIQRPYTDNCKTWPGRNRR